MVLLEKQCLRFWKSALKAKNIVDVSETSRQKRKQSSARQLGHLVVRRRTTSVVDSGERRLGEAGKHKQKISIARVQSQSIFI